GAADWQPEAQADPSKCRPRTREEYPERGCGMGQTRLQLAPRLGREEGRETPAADEPSGSLVPALVAEQLREALPGTSTGVFVGSGDGPRLTGATGSLARLATTPSLVATAFAARRVVVGGDDDLEELREQGVEAA